MGEGRTQFMSRDLDAVHDLFECWCNKTSFPPRDCVGTWNTASVFLQCTMNKENIPD